MQEIYTYIILQLVIYLSVAMHVIANSDRQVPKIRHCVVLSSQTCTDAFNSQSDCFLEFIPVPPKSQENNVWPLTSPVRHDNDVATIQQLMSTFDKPRAECFVFSGPINGPRVLRVVANWSSLEMSYANDVVDI